MVWGRDEVPHALTCSRVHALSSIDSNPRPLSWPKQRIIFRFDLLGCSEHIDECRQRRAQRRRMRRHDASNDGDDDRRQVPLIIKPILITEEPPSPTSMAQNEQV